MARLSLRWKAYLGSATAAQNVDFVCYEDFHADKAGVIKGLADRFDLPFNRARVDARKDDQIGKGRDYMPRSPGPWKDVLAHADIGTIERICAAEMRRWGYLT